MGESLVQREKRLERLGALQGILKNQIEALSGLGMAGVVLRDANDSALQRVEALEVQVAREVLLTCEGIWELSGPRERTR